MPSKKKKYNARFPAGRIKKIMQTDEEVGKVAQAVPIIISRTLELFVESLLKKSMQITQARNAKTLTPSHMKQCILSESRFDFLKDLVKNIPDASVQEDNENNALYEAHLEYKAENHQNMEVQPVDERLMQNPADHFYSEPNTSRSVIQFGPNIQQQQQPPPPPQPALNFQINNDNSAEPKLHITIASDSSHVVQSQNSGNDNVPPLIPLSHNIYTNNVGDNLCIDEDYDN